MTNDTNDETRTTVEPAFAPFLDWAEEAVGGRVVRCERQGERRSGGRPAFFIDFARGDETVSTYARMARGDGQLIGKAFGLEREYRILERLGEHGIRVPRVYGLCEDPLGILMESVDGDFDYTPLAPGPARDALDRDFLEELDRLHRIDAASWADLGLHVPESAEEIALGDLGLWEKTYHRALRRPVPLVEFATRWLHRNVPVAPDRIALIQGDTGPGQFIFEGSRVRAIIDWEFAHLADPTLDLAQIRTRDFYNPGGDMSAWMRTYAEVSGRQIDLPRLRYYTVKAMLITPLALAGVCQNMVQQTDHAEWYAQDVTYKRATAEALAEALGVETSPAPTLTSAATEADAIFDLLDQNLREEHRPAAPDGYARYRFDLALRLSRHLRNVERYGDELARAEAEDRAQLLGARVDSEAGSEAALLARIDAEAPEDDAALVAYLHRRCVREEAVWVGRPRRRRRRSAAAPRPLTPVGGRYLLAMLKIYHSKQSRSMRVVWLCEELGLDYEVETLAMFTPEMKDAGLPRRPSPRQGAGDRRRRIRALGNGCDLRVSGREALGRRAAATTTTRGQAPSPLNGWASARTRSRSSWGRLRRTPDRCPKRCASPPWSNGGARSHRRWSASSNARSTTQATSWAPRSPPPTSCSASASSSRAIWASSAKTPPAPSPTWNASQRARRSSAPPGSSGRHRRATAAHAPPPRSGNTAQCATSRARSSGLRTW